MRKLVLALLASISLPVAAGCSKAEAGDVPTAHPTPQGVVERVDRLQFLSNASSALTRAEDAWHHGGSPQADLVAVHRLVDLARRSASTGGEPMEAEWEGKAAKVVSSLEQNLGGKDAEKAEAELEQAKLFLDQAQEAAQIEL